MAPALNCQQSSEFEGQKIFSLKVLFQSRQKSVLQAGFLCADLQVT